MAHLMLRAPSTTANWENGGGEEEEEEVYNTYKVHTAELRGFITDEEGERWDCVRKIVSGECVASRFVAPHSTW